jgi:5-methylcytosine-specific restriction endonuclease McrA
MTAREIVLERAGGRCEECGRIPPPTKDGRRALHIHHLSYPAIDTAANLRVLCSPCHRSNHTKREYLDAKMIRMSEADVRRLEALKQKLETTEAAVMRQALRELAAREGVE